jgi:hypothetical protein
MVIFDDAEERWNLFYVAYRGPREDEKVGVHYSGKIWRAVSRLAGREGIGGPYVDVGIVMQQDDKSEAWEGQQGPDSFYPYRVGEEWRALYGGKIYTPSGPWLVGLASAKRLAGPWTRLPAMSPSPIEPDFIENPIVTTLDDGHYIAVYDSCAEIPRDASGAVHYGADAINIGYSFSTDGEHWPRGKRLAVCREGNENWTTDVRTPLGLIPEGGNRFTMLFTAQRAGKQFWSMGMVRVALED